MLLLWTIQWRWTDTVGTTPEESLADEDIALGATNGFADLDGENLSNFPAEGEGQQLTIDLGGLQESINALKQSIEEDEEVDLSEFLGEGEKKPDADGDGVPDWARQEARQRR